MTRPYREAPPPLEGNDQVIAAVGTIAWAIALVVVLLLRDHIAEHGRLWIWTCAAGLGLGLFALAYIPYLKRSRERTAARRQAARDSGDAG